VGPELELCSPHAEKAKVTNIKIPNATMLFVTISHFLEYLPIQLPGALVSSGAGRIAPSLAWAGIIKRCANKEISFYWLISHMKLMADGSGELNAGGAFASSARGEWG
jgi:hypothetical protein